MRPIATAFLVVALGCGAPPRPAPPAPPPPTAAPVPAPQPSAPRERQVDATQRCRDRGGVPVHIVVPGETSPGGNPVAVSLDDDEHTCLAAPPSNDRPPDSP
jgi:hypothetical protein